MKIRFFDSCRFSDPESPILPFSTFLPTRWFKSVELIDEVTNKRRKSGFYDFYQFSAFWDFDVSFKIWTVQLFDLIKFLIAFQILAAKWCFVQMSGFLNFLPPDEKIVDLKNWLAGWSNGDAGNWRMHLNDELTGEIAFFNFRSSRKI